MGARECEFREREPTDFGDLVVEQDHAGQWFAYRNDYPLMRGDKPAIFATFEEARELPMRMYARAIQIRSRLTMDLLGFLIRVSRPSSMPARSTRP